MTPPSLLLCLMRGFKGRCPQCGVGALFEKWIHLNQRCLHCSLDLRPRDSDVYFFMYIFTAMTTAFYIGIVGYIMIAHPSFYGEHTGIIWTILMPALFLSIVGSSRKRKGMGVALDYYFERKSFL